MKAGERRQGRNEEKTRVYPVDGESMIESPGEVEKQTGQRAKNRSGGRNLRNPAT